MFTYQIFARCFVTHDFHEFLRTTSPRELKKVVDDDQMSYEFLWHYRQKNITRLSDSEGGDFNYGALYVGAFQGRKTDLTVTLDRQHANFFKPAFKIKKIYLVTPEIKKYKNIHYGTE
ncbi:hypothetical protein FHQ08_09195 [Lactobacillus sp. CC-MHH1034]|uniref:hypothetical protein n=1 Tax=Agrilactobacillus fermenti TaxID=2586909 RepID=UPI001E3C8631|nr:hypothetical protein [Agrilactobacillus fermenti]MCD2256897.1 hypothetical protein [Agrilactobacillus fermenti]